MSLLSRFENIQQKVSLEEVTDMSHTVGLVESLYGAACYLPPVSAVALVWRGKDSAFVSFHAKQALLLQLVGFLVIAIVPTLFKWVFGALLLIILALAVYYAIKRQIWHIPVLSSISEGIEI